MAARNSKKNQKAISFAESVLDGSALRQIGNWARRSFVQLDKAGLTDCITTAMALNVLLRIKADVCHAKELASHLCRLVDSDDTFKMMKTLIREPDDLKLGGMLDMAGRLVMDMADFAVTPAGNMQLRIEFS